jgi:hypothetical protein
MLSANWWGRCTHMYKHVKLGQHKRGAGALGAHASAHMHTWLTSKPSASTSSPTAAAAAGSVPDPVSAVPGAGESTYTLSG